MGNTGRHGVTFVRSSNVWDSRTASPFWGSMESALIPPGRYKAAVRVESALLDDDDDFWIGETLMVVVSTAGSVDVDFEGCYDTGTRRERYQGSLQALSGGDATGTAMAALVRTAGGSAPSIGDVGMEASLAEQEAA